MFDVTTMPVGVLQCNCSIISCKKTREAIIVDPGGDADRIVKIVEEGGFKVTHLLHTHAHLDHFAATGDVHKHTGGCIALHKDDMFLYEQAPMQSMMLGLPPVSPPDITHHIQDEEEYVFGENVMKALYTPGHTPGSASFLIDDGTNQLLFSGDTLFRRGIGRTDLPGGDSAKIVKSIKNRLYTLDDGTQVIPGHGPMSTIGEERYENPFVRR